MDGLRGFLALAVVLHHVAIYHAFLQAHMQSDGWTTPPSRFYASLGPMGVSMFFMITGYLFWSRLLREHGRPAWMRLYIGRLFRIAPLYLAVMALASLLDLTSHVPAAMDSKSREVTNLALLGLSVYSDPHKFLAGVTWSIQLEWLFYLSLPFLAVFAFKKKYHLFAAAFALCACLLISEIKYSGASDTQAGLRLVRTALFLVGILSASLHSEGLRPGLPNWLSSLVIAIAVPSVFIFHDAFSPGPVILLGVTFFLIASGTTFFGVLTSRPAIRMGDISYSIYLAQGLVLAAIFRPAYLSSFGLSSPWHAWCLSLAAMVALVTVALGTYLLIEKPGIALGQRVALRLTRKPETAAVSRSQQP